MIAGGDSMRLHHAVLSLTLALCACSTKDTGLGFTGSSRDYLLTMYIKTRDTYASDVTIVALVGEAVPVNITLRRTNSSYLPLGLKGSIQLTAMGNVTLSRQTIPVNVTTVVTPDVSDSIIFTGKEPGSVEIRATFQDATDRAVIRIIPPPIIVRA